MASKSSDGEEFSSTEKKAMLARESKLFLALLFLAELFFLIIYGIWIDYERIDDAASIADVPRMYAYFRDVNIMIFFGFGFLMTFLRRYGYSAVGYTFLISAMATQWSVILEAFFTTVSEKNYHFSTWNIGIVNVLNGLFCSGAVMISYGGILGRITPLQMMIMGLIEPVFYWLNVFISILKLEAIDIGGGMTIHLFGAVFGLTVTWFMTYKRAKVHKDNAPAYNNDLFSFAGTLFLFMMWPSFNAAVARPGQGELRALLNTFLSITSSVLSTFLISRFLSDDHFEAVHIQNSALAGGVAMGVAADLYITPAGAMLCGFVVGAISVFGFKYLTPFLTEKCHIQDTCGIANLHGLPGFCSSLIGVFVPLAAAHIQKARDHYFGEYDTYFPRGDKQAGYQMAATMIAIGLGIAGGLVAGFLMKLSNKLNRLSTSEFYNDNAFWHVPSDYNQFEESSNGTSASASHHKVEQMEVEDTDD